MGTINDSQPEVGGQSALSQIKSHGLILMVRWVSSQGDPWTSKRHINEPEANDTTRGEGGQSAGEGNTAAGAEHHTWSGPLQSASCKKPTHGGNTFKHTLFTLLNNIKRAQHSVQVSFGCISDVPFAPLSVQQNMTPRVLIQSGTLFCECHASTAPPFLCSIFETSVSFYWLGFSTSNCFSNNLKTHNQTSLTTAKEAHTKTPGINKPNIIKYLQNL